MLHGIHPALDGDTLRGLDRLGHGDAVLIADANFPAFTAGAPVATITLDAPTVVSAVRTLIPVDQHEGPAVHLMTAASDVDATEVHGALRSAAATDDARIASLERHEFYALARESAFVIRTAETRAYGNLVLRKGVVTVSDERRPA